MRRTVTGLVLAVVAVAAAMAPARPVAAHAELLGVEPPDGAVLATAPEEVRLIFNEPVGLDAGSARVLQRDGTDVAQGARAVDTDIVIDLPPDLPDGTYTIAYETISADGHRITGATVFSVGADDGGGALVIEDREDPPATLRAGRTVFVGIATASTLLAVGLWWSIAHVFGTDAGRARIRGLVGGLAAIGVTALVVGLPIRIGAVGGTEALRDGDTFRSLATGALGAATLVSGLGLVGLALGATRRWPPWLVSACGLVALIGFGLEGHTRASSPIALAITSDVVHLSAGAVWVGGVLGLLVLRQQTATDGSQLATAARRFSTVAAGAVGLVALAGAVLAALILPTLSALWDTGYGRTLLVKVALVATVVGLGALNRFVIVPRLRDEAGARRRLAGTLAVEAVLLLAVITTAAALVQQSPTSAARPAPASTPTGPDTLPSTSGAPRPAELTLALGRDVVAALDGVPDRTGSALVTVMLTDGAGAPVEPVQPPTVEVSSATLGVGPLDWMVHDLGGGRYHVMGTVPAPGQWDLTVRVRVDDFTSLSNSATIAIGS